MVRDKSRCVPVTNGMCFEGPIVCHLLQVDEGIVKVKAAPSAKKRYNTKGPRCDRNLVLYDWRGLFQLRSTEALIQREL